jgi:hypothetical protein
MDTSRPGQLGVKTHRRSDPPDASGLPPPDSCRRTPHDLAPSAASEADARRRAATTRVSSSTEAYGGAGTTDRAPLFRLKARSVHHPQFVKRMPVAAPGQCECRGMRMSRLLGCVARSHRYPSFSWQPSRGAPRTVAPGMAALPLVTRVQSQDRVRRVGVLMPIAADDAEAPPQSPARQRSSHRSNNSAVAEASVRQRTGDLDIVGIDEF